MRLFIAIDLGELAGYFRQLQDKIPEVKATFPKEFHLTLKFLGEVPDSKVDEIKKRLVEVKFSEFKARLSGMGIFENERFIRVVWVGIEDGKHITDLQQKIETALEGMFARENRFSPHLTLARVKFIEEDKKKGFVNAIKSINVEPKEISIKNFKLIKSTLTKQGPVYEIIRIF